MRKEFKVLSSDGVTSYVVEFLLESGKLHIHCGCPAGVLGKWCKHKMSFVSGDVAGVLESSAASDVAEVLIWIKNSEFSRLLDEMNLAEGEMREAKIKMDKTKKALERAAQKGALV